MKTEALVDEALQLLSDGIDGTAIIACSGGIDSTVAAVLAHRAVGDLLHCVYVDTGLMRLGESDEVREIFDEMGIDIKVVDASRDSSIASMASQTLRRRGRPSARPSSGYSSKSRRRWARSTSFRGP